MGKNQIEINKLPPARVANSKIYAIMNNKGGVGKSTLAIALGLYMARSGRNVLFVDCDSQRNLTQRLGLNDNMNVERLGRMFREADIEGPKPDLSVVAQYKRTMKMRGAEHKGVISIIPGDRNAVTEANSAVERLRNSYFSIDRRNIFRYFRDQIDQYRNYYDAIITDTAPALEGNIVNRLAAQTADEIIVPVDGVEAANGVDQMIQWVNYETSTENSGIGHRPNMTFAMVKYHEPTTDTARSEVENLAVHNEVYRAMVNALGPYMCKQGVKESSKLKRIVSGVGRGNEYTKLSAELAATLAVSRRSVFDYYTHERAAELRKRLAALSEKALDKDVTFKSAIYKEVV